MLKSGLEMELPRLIWQIAVMSCSGQQYCLADGPGYYAEKKVAQKSPGEELSNDRKILPYPLSLTEQKRDKDRGTIGDTYGAVTYSEDESLHGLTCYRLSDC